MPPQMDNISFRRYRISCRRRISYGRYRLLRNKHLKGRQKLKRERKKLKHERKRMLMVKRETLEIHRALTPSVDARADVVCECCFEAIKIDEYGDSPYEKCKECQRLLCSNCCFASEKAPLWYCRMCVVTKRLMPIWRPTTEGRHDFVLSVSFLVRRQGRVYGEAMLA